MPDVAYGQSQKLPKKSKQHSKRANSIGSNSPYQCRVIFVPWLSVVAIFSRSLLDYRLESETRIWESWVGMNRALWRESLLPCIFHGSSGSEANSQQLHVTATMAPEGSISNMEICSV